MMGSKKNNEIDDMLSVYFNDIAYWLANDPDAIERLLNWLHLHDRQDSDDPATAKDTQHLFIDLITNGDIHVKYYRRASYEKTLQKKHKSLIEAWIEGKYGR